MATISVVFMNESSSWLTALRIIDAAVRMGHHVNVMAARGKHDDALAALMHSADKRGQKVHWTRPDEGSAVEFWRERVMKSDNVLVIPKR